jgi:hypothetical protein
VRRSFVAVAALALLGSLPVVAGILNSAAGGSHNRVPEAPAAPANTVPTWDSLNETRDIATGASCALNLTTVASDADMDSITFSASGLPTGCSFSTPSVAGTASAVGTYSVTFGADDGDTEIISAGFATTAFATNNLFTARGDIFVTEYTLTPAAASINLVCGHTELEAATSFTDLRTSVRASTDEFTEPQVTYASGVADTIRIIANLQTSTYTVTVDGSTIYEDAAFRGAATPETFQNFVCLDAAGATEGSTIGSVFIDPPVQKVVTWTVYASGDVTAPAQPTAPTVAGVTHNAITLTWTASAEMDLDHYELERAVDCGSSFSDIAAAQDLAVLTYTDTGLDPDEDYCYRLVATDASGNDSTASSGVLGETYAAPNSEWPKLTWDDVGHTGALSAYAGPSTISSSTTVSNVLITGRINVTGDNVTFSNVRFASCSDGFLLYVDPAATGLLVEDATFEGSTTATIRVDGGATVRRSRFRDAQQDLIKLGGGGPAITFEGNYFEGLGQGGTDWHADGFQIQRGAGLVTIRGNTFNTPSDPYLDLPAAGCGIGEGATTTKQGRTLFWGTTPAALVTQQAIVEYNFIEGSQYGVQSDGVITGANLIVRYNVFGREFRNAPWSGPMTNYGNTWESSGVVESPNIGSGDTWYGPWVADALLPGQDSEP